MQCPRGLDSNWLRCSLYILKDLEKKIVFFIWGHERVATGLRASMIIPRGSQRVASQTGRRCNPSYSYNSSFIYTCSRALTFKTRIHLRLYSFWMRFILTFTVLLKALPLWYILPHYSLIRRFSFCIIMKCLGS